MVGFMLGLITEEDRKKGRIEKDLEYMLK